MRHLDPGMAQIRVFPVIKIIVIRQVRFECVVSKNPQTPNLSPMADEAITRGGTGSLISPLYICVRKKKRENGTEISRSKEPSVEQIFCVYFYAAKNVDFFKYFPRITF